MEELKDKNKILVVSDYEPKSRFNLSNIRIKYKIKDQLYAVPHNYLFADACNMGNVVDYFYRNINAEPKDYNGQFILQVNEIVEKIFEMAKLRDN